MNEIVVRTNAVTYSGGDIIYGAIYLHVGSPVYGDVVILEVNGLEHVVWTAFEFDKAGKSYGSVASGVDDFVTYEEEYVGTWSWIEGQFKLYEFREGAVPIGSYAFPFQFPLPQGVPSSFSRKLFFDKEKNIKCSCSIAYEITGKLCHASATKLKGNQSFLVDCAESSRKAAALQNACQSIEKPVYNCCCVKTGTMSLLVKLRESWCQVGGEVVVALQVTNHSSKLIRSGSVRLVRVTSVEGYATRKKSAENLESRTSGYCETVYDRIFNLDDAKDTPILRDVVVPVTWDEDESITSSSAKYLKCSYLIEVDIHVPDDIDLSVTVPVIVNNQSSREWSSWEPPPWIACAVVRDVQGINAVPKRTYLSKEFTHVHLPLNVGTL